MRNPVIKIEIMKRWIAAVIFLSLCYVPAKGSPADDSSAPAKHVATMLAFPYSEGWLGADDAYSIPFGEGKSIWLFGDTFVGERNTTLRSKAKTMVRNSVGITTCPRNKECQIRYYWQNPQAAKPRSFFDTRKGDEWYWPMDGYLDGETLYLSLMIVRNRPGASPADPFGFEIAGTRWAKVTNLSATPDHWKVSITEFTQRELWAGSSIILDGEFLLLYAQVPEAEGKGYMIVLRVPMKKIENPAENLEYLGS